MNSQGALGNLTDLPALDRRRSLTDAVHDLLRDAIANGVLGPGTRLPEVTIARQLDVSATPVREALRRLSEAGLVETIPHRGASVVSCSPTDLANLYEIHEVLEGHAVRSATVRLAALPSEVRGAILASLVTVADGLDAVVSHVDQREFNGLDLILHRKMNVISGNDLLADEIEQIHRRIQTSRIRFEVHLPDRPARSQDQHRALLQLMERGDAEGAMTLAWEHIHAVRDVVISLLRASAHGHP